MEGGRKWDHGLGRGRRGRDSRLCTWSLSAQNVGPRPPSPTQSTGPEESQRRKPGCASPSHESQRNDFIPCSAFTSGPRRAQDGAWSRGRPCLSSWTEGPFAVVCKECSHARETPKIEMGCEEVFSIGEQTVAHRGISATPHLPSGERCDLLRSLQPKSPSRRLHFPCPEQSSAAETTLRRSQNKI